MFKASFGRYILTRPAGWAVALVIQALPAAAQTETLDQVRDYTRQGRHLPQAQVTSVSEFSDVKPTDWAFLALQSLVERYGCIAGYPTNPPTFKGNRALTRYEFAAGLNACLDRINELIEAATEPLATQEELAKVQKLQEMFAAELATLRGRVDRLEARTATLEAQPFSTTTKLAGEVIFALGGALPGDKAVPPNAPSAGKIDDNTTLSYRARLIFNSSFSGQDLLQTVLEARDISNFVAATGTRSAQQSFAIPGPPEAFTLRQLQYRFRVGETMTFWVQPVSIGLWTFANTLNPLDQGGSGAFGALSKFGERSPIYRLSGNTGGGFNVDFNPQVSLTLGYLASTGVNVGVAAPNAQSPTSGLFGSPYGALAQLTFRPTTTFSIATTYVRAYGVPPDGAVGVTGTTFAANPFNRNLVADGVNLNSYGLEFSWTAHPHFIWSGWFNLTDALATDRDLKATVINWALTFALPDLFQRKGDLAGIVVGQPPYVSTNSIGAREDQEKPVLVEGFYRFRLTRHVDLTPGIYTIFNPNGSSENDPVTIGQVRATFRF